MKEESFCADDFQMFQKYSEMVYRFAFSLVKNREDAQDIHQEVFVRYICSKPLFENEEHERAWFLRVTVNLCKNLWKTAWKRKVIGGYEEREEGQTVEWQEEDSLIDVVKKLPQKYRVVIHLFYYEELSIEEIAKILHAKPSTVRTQLTRARQQIKKLLEEDMDVSGSVSKSV